MTERISPEEARRIISEHTAHTGISAAGLYKVHAQFGLEEPTKEEITQAEAKVAAPPRKVPQIENTHRMPWTPPQASLSPREIQILIQAGQIRQTPTVQDDEASVPQRILSEEQLRTRELNIAHQTGQISAPVPPPPTTQPGLRFPGIWLGTPPADMGKKTP